MHSNTRYNLPSIIIELTEQASKFQREWPLGWPTRALPNAELWSSRETRSHGPTGHTRQQRGYATGRQSTPGICSPDYASRHTLDNAACGRMRCFFDAKSSPLITEYYFKRHPLEIFPPEPGKCEIMFWQSVYFFANLSL